LISTHLPEPWKTSAILAMAKKPPTKQVAAAKAAATPPSPSHGTDWSQGVVSPGGGVAATIGALRKALGKNKNPTKEQVAIRIDPEVLAAFRVDGPGWQTRMNTALKE